MSLIDDIIASEGYRSDPYKDTKGIWTGGYGHMMLPKDWSFFNPKWSKKEKREYWTKQLANDLSIATQDIDWLTFEWPYKPTDPEKEVLIELAFNLGLTRLQRFKKFLLYMSKSKIKEAAKELIDSKWHRDFVLWNSNRDEPHLRSRRLERKLLNYNV